MIRTIFCSISALSFCLALSVSGFSQQAPDKTWKKRVYRLIDMNEVSTAKENALKQVKSDKLLIQIFEDAIKSGKLTAYTATDDMFSTRLMPDQLAKMVSNKRDTMIVIDPINGDETTKYRITDFDYSTITKYRILEDWTLDPATGKTEIRIAGIAPEREVYGDAGQFRGLQAMFWLKYNDAISVLVGYEQLHPENTLASKIWADYFTNDQKPGTSGK